MYSKKIFSFAVALTMLLTISLFLACGGGGTSTPAAQPAPTPTVVPSTAVQVRVGDAPADRVVSFEMTLKSLVLISKSGEKVTIISEPRRIEFARLAGSLEPVTMLSIPQGTYNKGTLVSANPHIAYVDNEGKVQEYTQKGDITTTIMLDKPLVIGTKVALINAELDMAATVTSIDGTNATPPKFEPLGIISISEIAATNQKDETGALQHAIGLVTAVSGTSFTLKVGQNGIELPFAVDASTEFQNVTLTTLPDMLVHVTAISGQDGALHAVGVEGLTNSRGAVLEGVIVADDRSGDYYSVPTSLTFVPEDGTGNGMLNELVGKPLTVDIANANYTADTQDVPNMMPNVSPYEIVPGQKARIDTDTGILPTADKKGYQLTARMVAAEQQMITGIVVEQPPSTTLESAVYYSRYLANIWVQLPADSALVLLGQSALRTPYVQIWISTDTALNGASIADLMGKTVRVRGFLRSYFWNNPGDTFGLDATSLEVVTAAAEPNTAWTSK